MAWGEIDRKRIKDKIQGVLGSCEPYDEERLKGLQEYRVKIRVIDSQGECAAGHTVGDEIEVTGPIMTKGRICIWAYPLLHSVIVNKRFGLRMPYEDSDKVQVVCEDWGEGGGTVTFDVSTGERLPRPKALEEARAALRRSNE